MIRRTAWYRTLATLLAAWLPLIAGEPGVLQPCPMHGAGRAVVASLRGQAVEPQMTGDAAAAMPTHQHHAGAASATTVTDQPAPASGHDHHACSCIDGCSAASAVAFVVPTEPPMELQVAEFPATRSVPSVASLARPAPEFSRPYTTGPPRA